MQPSVQNQEPIKEEQKTPDQVEKIKSEHTIDRMVKAVPLGYAFIFFCGALYLHFYYNTFRIPIFKFLDLTEIATSFLPIIIVIIICMGAIFSFFLVQIPLEKHLSKSKFFYDKNWMTFLLCLTCGLYIYLSYKTLEKESVSFHFRTYRTGLWIGFLCFAFAVLLFTKKMQLIIVNLTMIFMTAVVHESIKDVYETIHNAKVKSYVITTTDNETINTDSTYYFVNRTHNYIFLYSTKHHDYNAIPLSEVKKIDLK
jgi:hypothetical protein